VSITSDLIEALRNHYIAPGEITPGGVFAAEVGINGHWGTGRRCDALYAGFTSQSGRILIGHEVKVSRSDWNHEREQLAKADDWADQCHAWYLVAPSEAIIPASEVPPGWGLMVPNLRAKRRFKIVVKATIHKDRNPSWGAVRSMMARMDTLRAGEMKDIIRERVSHGVAEALQRKEEDRLRMIGSREKAREEAIQTIEAGVGMSIVDWARRHDEQVTAEEFVTVLNYIRAARETGRGWRGLPALAENAQAAIEQLRTVASTATALTEVLQADVPEERRAS
jgi:hypothetical protein